MKYLILGALTEAGQRMQGPDLEAWMAEIGAWYEKNATTGKIADPDTSSTGRTRPRRCGRAG